MLLVVSGCLTHEAEQEKLPSNVLIIPVTLNLVPEHFSVQALLHHEPTTSLHLNQTKVATGWILAAWF